MKTSVHFNAVKSDSEAHNFRKKNYYYIRKDLSENNEYWQEEKIAIRLQRIENYCKEKSGRKLQKNAMPIREAVVVIKENTTLFELHNFAKKLEEELKIRIFQMAIHKDEGHYDKETKDWKPNYHAHLVADWQDLQTGKTLKHQSFHYSKMQDLAANCLGMERGNSKNGIKRLEAIEFKIAAKEKDLEIIENKIQSFIKVFHGKVGESLSVVETGMFGIKKESVDKTILNFNNTLKIHRSKLQTKEKELTSKTTQNDKLNNELKTKQIEIEKVKQLNLNLLINKELYERKRNEYLKSVLNLIEKSILNKRFTITKSEHNDLNKEMKDLCNTIFLKNNIPFEAIVEIFKDSEQKKHLYSLLTKAINETIEMQNEKTEKKDNKINFARRRS